MFENCGFLPSPQFPVVFENVKGICKQSKTGSFFNKEEIEIVMFYIGTILNGIWNTQAGHIGVISPYKSQCDLIKGECQQLGYDGISIGSAEFFQGQEKKVIIISTVRSDNELGFLNDEKVRARVRVSEYISSIWINILINLRFFFSRD